MHYHHMVLYMLYSLHLPPVMSEPPCPSESEQLESCHCRYRTNDLHQKKTEEETEHPTGFVNLSTKPPTINSKISMQEASGH